VRGEHLVQLAQGHLRLAVARVAERRLEGGGGEVAELEHARPLLLRDAEQVGDDRDR
jgi:hypothetical protein